MEVKGLGDLNQAMAYVDQIVYSAYYGEEKKIAVINELLQVQTKFPSEVYRSFENFKTSLMNFESDEALAEIKRLLQCLQETKYIDINVMRHMLIDMMGVYSAAAQKVQSSIDEISINGSILHYQSLIKLPGISQVYHWFIEFHKLFFEKFFIRYKCGTSDILRVAIDYVEKHLYEAIHLSEVAAVVGVSDSYLSTLFKKNMNENFVSYVNRKKMERAKEMLAEGKLVYVISVWDMKMFLIFQRFFGKCMGFLLMDLKNRRS